MRFVRIQQHHIARTQDYRAPPVLEALLASRENAEGEVRMRVPRESESGINAFDDFHTVDSGGDLHSRNGTRLSHLTATQQSYIVPTTAGATQISTIRRGRRRGLMRAGPIRRSFPCIGKSIHA